MGPNRPQNTKMETSENRRTQIIIVGGGVTGLSLALMLERLDVSYVLLEAYPILTKAVGTTIALLANGLRILDQLGLLEQIQEAGQTPLKQEIIDGNTGRKDFEMDLSELANDFLERHGYSGYVMPRHEFLKILEKQLKNRDCLLTNKRVKEIEQSDSAASVICEDGTRYDAQIVVGADGIRSTVRREMWRLAAEKSPGWFPEKHMMSCEYAVAFATAPPSQHFSPGDLISIERPGSNAGIVCGRQAQLFLFYYWRLHPPHITFLTDAIPHIPPSEREARWADAAKLPLSRGGLTFGDIMATGMARPGATMLPHHAFEKWWFGRVVVIGDAAHKFNPLMSQGGNNCIESAAALVNQLERCLEERGVSLQAAEWPREALAEAFTALERERLPRVKQLIEMSQTAQHVAARETRLYDFIAKYILWLVPKRMHVDMITSYVVGCSRLKGKVWDRPDKEHSIPWGDEWEEGKKEEEEESSNLLCLTMILSAVVISLLAISIGLWRRPV